MLVAKILSICIQAIGLPLGGSWVEGSYLNCCNQWTTSDTVYPGQFLAQLLQSVGQPVTLCIQAGF